MRHELLQESVVDLVRHDEALAVDAGLAVIVEPGLRANLGSLVEIGIFQDHIGVVGTELEDGLLDRLARLLADVAARAVRSGERDTADLVVFDDFVGRVMVDHQHGEEVSGGLLP